VSEGIKRPRERALVAARQIVKIISPACSRVEIAGSIRREKDEVSDIEIVAIPNYTPDLFGNQFYSAAIVSEILRGNGFEFNKNGENYKKFFYVSYQIWVDLFLTTPEQWGIIYMIRTGSADFSHKMVTSKQQGGYMPSNYRVDSGRVWHVADKEPFKTPEEKDIFDLWGLKFIEPKNRTG